MNRTLRRGYLAVLTLVLLTAGGAAWLVVSHQVPASLAPRVGGPFRLVGDNGLTFTEANFRGQPVLVFFGYTHCPDICPTTLFNISEAFAKLGPDKDIGALFITVDPERDTPAVLKDYLSSFDPRILGLTGTRADVEAAMRRYRVYAKKIPGSGTDYSMDHSAIVYLMNKQGAFVEDFNLERTPEEAAKELASYL